MRKSGYRFFASNPATTKDQSARFDDVKSPEALMTYRWFDLGSGRKVYRKVPEPKSERSALPCPRIVRDFDEPVQSMADGKWYSSKAALARSHKASGNPLGEDFIELGNETPQFKEHVPDAQKRRDDIRQALHDVVTGNLPPEIAAIE